MSEVRVELPPGCEGIDTPDRSRTYSGRRGESALVDDPHYARQLQAAGMRILPSRAIGFSNAPGWDCTCGRSNFAWAEKCSGCGGTR